MIRWKNSSTQFGIIAIGLHWLVAIVVFGLFALGWWMTELDYYDSWYQLAPWWHKSIGSLLFIVVLLRLMWRFISPPPQPLPSHKRWEVAVAHLVHGALYLLLLLIMVSGYLISTAEGRGIEVFDWFSIPATITSFEEQADIFGWIHWILACVLIGMVLLHALAAVKHHVIDGDSTLRRILGR